jgi:hypothetical protein
MVPTLQTVLQVQDVPGYAQAHPKQPNDKALLVDWDGRPFALLYITPTAYTLAWEGVVAFDRLEAEVTGALKAFGQADVSLSTPAWRNRTSVAFVFQRQDDSDELVKYHLGRSREFTLYSQAMTDPLAISFARYDFSESIQSGYFFSFIAENPALQPGLGNEVALKLPRHHKWTDALLEWVIMHHRQSNLLTQELMQGPSVSALNQYLEIP